MNTPLIHSGNVTEVYGSTEEMVRQRIAIPLGKWEMALTLRMQLFSSFRWSKHITGIELVIDGGITLKVK